MCCTIDSRNLGSTSRGFCLSSASYIERDLAYCKSLISKVPLTWGAGFHYTQYAPIILSCVLFHLRAMDYEISRQRIHILNSVVFSSNALEKHHSAQFRMKEEEYLQLY